MPRNKRILFGASYSVIEPLGLLHLAGLARDCGWDRKIHLVKDHNFEPFFDVVKDFQPDIVGFNVYTGNHRQLYEAFNRLKKESPNIITVVGGPHPTYFPADAAKHADYVVMSEGFGSLRKILRGKVNPGILTMSKTERFPHPDRTTFYNDYVKHAESRIKSIITMTGCPYSCTYCYNSSTPDDIKEHITPEIAEKLGKAMGMGGRLFPHNVRSVDDVVKEGKEIRENWTTEVIYSQDDVHGFDIRNWMVEFSKLWPNEVGIPYHAQMRWEMTAHDGGKRRIELLKKAGCFGLTLAIEAADPLVRSEVLDRAMPSELMYNGMKALIDNGFRVRTEQITGLPYGATSMPTAINLDADLQLIELNVNLRKETKGPTMAWASTLAPYKGTKLGLYCEKYGHYIGDNSDVPDTFFERSVLRFPNEWIGLGLEKRKNDYNVWLCEGDLEKYRDQNAELRRLFNFFTLVPEGHKLAESYLRSNEPYSYERLERDTIKHLKSLPYEKEANELLENIANIKLISSQLSKDDLEHKLLIDLAGYFGCLPRSELAAERFLKYGRERGYTSRVLSDATRHHLYDEVLYAINRSNLNEHLEESNRYLAKV